MPEFRAGQIIPLRYKTRELKTIIIDPNGLGPDKPSIGMGFRSMDRHIGVPRQTLSDRMTEIEGVKYSSSHPAMSSGCPKSMLTWWPPTLV